MAGNINSINSNELINAFICGLSLGQNISGNNNSFMTAPMFGSAGGGDDSLDMIMGLLMATAVSGSFSGKPTGQFALPSAVKGFNNDPMAEIINLMSNIFSNPQNNSPATTTKNISNEKKHNSLKNESYNNYQLKPEQMNNAQIIADVMADEAKKHGKNPEETKQAIKIALMTALVESRLRNLNYGDRDSLGLFQQRANWGSKEERMNPETATRKFAKDLFGKNYMNMTPNDAAQAVQRSAFPFEYGKWEGVADKLLAGAYKQTDTMV